MYKDETPLEHQTAVGILRAMINAEDKARKSIRSKSFEKYIAVANNKNGEEFFDEVSYLHHLLFTAYHAHFMLAQVECEFLVLNLL